MKKNFAKRLFIALTLAMMFTMVLAMGVFADDAEAGDAIVEGVTEASKSIYVIVRQISLPLAVVALVLSALCWFFAGQKYMEQAKAFLGRLAITFICIFGASAIVYFVAGIFKNIQDPIFGDLAYVITQMLA